MAPHIPVFYGNKQQVYDSPMSAEIKNFQEFLGSPTSCDNPGSAGTRSLQENQAASEVRASTILSISSSVLQMWGDKRTPPVAEQAMP